MNLDSGVSIERGEPQVAVTGEDRLVKGIEALLVEMGQDTPVHESDFGSCDAATFRAQGIPSAFAHARRVTPYPHPHLALPPKTSPGVMLVFEESGLKGG